MQVGSFFCPVVEQKLNNDPMALHMYNSVVMSLATSACFLIILCDDDFYFLICHVFLHMLLYAEVTYLLL